MTHNEDMRYDMTKADARKITVMEELLAHRLTVLQATKLLGLSERQVLRLKAEAAENGAVSVLHKGRGRRPANALPQALESRIIAIYRERLSGYNFSHAADVLSDEYGIAVSRSTVSRCLRKSGIPSPKQRRRPKRHRARFARTHEGELVQMDASRFDWLSTGSLLHLHGAIDDATGKVLALHLEQEETFEGYCELMRQMNQDGHLPRELYTDRRSVFAYTQQQRRYLSVAEQLDGVPEKPTQFARALQMAGIVLVLAGSPQAKGLVERLWGTLQDRLPKDLERHGIHDIDAVNAYLKAYVPRFNQRFAERAEMPEALYRQSLPPDRFELVFARHETRRLDHGLAFSYLGQRYRLPRRADGVLVEAAPSDSLSVVTSRKVGLKVIYKGQVLTPEPLPAPALKSARPAPKSAAAALPGPCPARKPKVSPWHGFTYAFYSDDKRHDISADQLAAAKGDI